MTIPEGSIPKAPRAYVVAYVYPMDGSQSLSVSASVETVGGGTTLLQELVLPSEENIKGITIGEVESTATHEWNELRVSIVPKEDVSVSWGDVQVVLIADITAGGFPLNWLYPVAVGVCLAWGGAVALSRVARRENA